MYMSSARYEAGGAHSDPFDSMINLEHDLLVISIEEVKLTLVKQELVMAFQWPEKYKSFFLADQVVKNVQVNLSFRVQL